MEAWKDFFFSFGKSMYCKIMLTCYMLACVSMLTCLALIMFSIFTMLV